MCLRMNYKIGTSSYSFRNSREDAPGRARLLGWKQHTGIPALAILDPCIQPVTREDSRGSAGAAQPAGRYLCLSTYVHKVVVDSAGEPPKQRLT